MLDKGLLDKCKDIALLQRQIADMAQEKINMESEIKELKQEIKRKDKTINNFKTSLESEIKEKWDKAHKDAKQIKELEQQVQDTEQALTGAIDCINDMKCCGNCGKYEDCLDNENAFYRNVCGKWKQKENKC